MEKQVREAKQRAMELDKPTRAQGEADPWSRRFNQDALLGLQGAAALANGNVTWSTNTVAANYYSASDVKR